jgi:hypothetical protein
MLVTLVMSHVSAASGAGLPAPPVIRVTMGQTPVAMTVDTVNPRPAGRVTFEVRTTTTDDGRDFQIVKLARGVTIEQVAALVRDSLGGDRFDPAALQRLYRWVTFLGGVTANPGGVSSETLTLAAGVYYLLDTSSDASDEQFAAAKRLEVRGRIQPTAVPRIGATVDMRDPHVFQTIRHLPADGSILVRNTDTEPHFMSMRPVPAGTTDSQVQAIFDRLMAGDENAFDDMPGLEGDWVGTGTISPGYQQVLTYHVPAGLYVMECFWPDSESGMPHAFMGMHKIVSIG